jgi:hypothetical protein
MLPHQNKSIIFKLNKYPHTYFKNIIFLSIINHFIYRLIRYYLTLKESIWD